MVYFCENNDNFPNVVFFKSIRNVKKLSTNIDLRKAYVAFAVSDSILKPIRVVKILERIVFVSQYFIF